MSRTVFTGIWSIIIQDNSGRNRGVNYYEEI